MENQKPRGQFAGNIGFILAAAGSAVGLGNLVKFPYLASKYGGGLFLLTYLLIVVLIGFPVMLAELTIGRSTHKNAIAAFRDLNKRFTWVGALGIIIGYMIVAYYNVIGGWSIKYFATYIIGGNFSGGADNFFGSFITAGFEPIVWLFLFLAATGFIVWRGIAGGIEKASKIMMPALAVLLIIVAIRSMTLPGAGAGIAFYLIPDFSKFSGAMVVAALGQVFFSLSLGMGIMWAYGSYLDDKENLSKNALIVPIFDTSIAVLAGFAVLPAMFATGFEPSASTVGSLFVVMPDVLSKLPLSAVFGAIFFLCVIFAALTSSISLLEGSVIYVTEEWHWSRGKAVLILSSVLMVLGSLASLSLGGNINIQFPQITSSGIGVSELFDFLSNTPDLLLMPICALMICIFVGWIWGTNKAIDHIESHNNKFILKRYWGIGIKYIAPIAILIILLNGIGVLKF